MSASTRYTPTPNYADVANKELRITDSLEPVREYGPTPALADERIEVSILGIANIDTTRGQFDAAFDRLEGLLLAAYQAGENSAREVHVAFSAAIRPMAKGIIGYFDSHEQETPTFDPGVQPCPICGDPWVPGSGNVRTVCVLAIGKRADGEHAFSAPRADKSLFYRVHKSCYDALPAAWQTALDTQCLDAYGGWFSVGGGQ